MDLRDNSQYVYFNIEDTFGLTQPLKDGVIKYKNYVGKSLYVPGIGWCPVSDKVLENYTTDPAKLSLRCSKDKDSFLHTVIVTSGDTRAWHVTFGEPYPCERLDIYVCYKNDSNNISIQHNAIRNEKGCEYLPLVVDATHRFEYFITVNGRHIYMSKEMAKHIEKNGFDNIRVKFDLYVPYLMFTPKDKEKEFAEYDRLLISLNKYKVDKLRFKGYKPFYFLEEDSWRNMDNHHLIIPNDVVDTKETITDSNTSNNVYSTKRKRKTFSPSIEQEINDLVVFFNDKGFTRSSEVSNYIREQELGYRFKHISGYLELSDGCQTWEFEGGIAPQYYAEICYRLGLNDNGSDAKTVGFECFEDRWEPNRR